MRFLSKDKWKNEAFCCPLFPGSTYVKNSYLKYDSLFLGAKHKEMKKSMISVSCSLDLVWESQLEPLWLSFIQKTTVLSLLPVPQKLPTGLSSFAFLYDCQIFQASNI